ncbi:NRDE family protein [Nannocystis sp.]|uniref:NRDE family protein n=1 Tax=Nannocystis sp. TaxID=1962667 RepID=UPI0025DAA237|nr:NRDE family protein [Nannocystis sp.]MBK7830206.1 NRDE family protein [Nannocystis sp.]
MCTLLLAWQVDPARPLIVAANRDEFYARPSAPAAIWPRASAADPEIVAGRDLQAGGTWLGVTRAGRFAALTNVRELGVATPPGAPSRGQLVADFLRGRDDPASYIAALRPERYAGFNLVVGDRDALWYLSNRSGPARALGPGVYGLANAGLDTPWPKVRRGRAALAAQVAAGEVTGAALLALLADRTPAPDAELPDTGVGLATERMLSPLLIASSGYGTCSSTALVIHRDGAVELHERSHNPARPGDASLTMSRGR